MDSKELEILIPSETVRNYILETGWVFTDKEKAALLFHNNLPLQEQHSYLRDLGAKTADKELREQITEYLDCKEQGFQAFKENENKNHIYVLRVKAEEEDQYYQIQPKRYFFDWKLAYECGKKKGQPFQLQKCVVYDVSKQSNDDNNPSVADLQFDEDGEALCFWSREVLFDEEKNGYFTYVFYEVPNPFEQGDIVKQAGTEDYGIVENSQEQWKEALARYQSDEWKGFGPDYSDVQIRVAFLSEDGTFGHAHVNPVVLDLYQPKIFQSPMDQLLLSASDLYKGKGSLDELYYATMAYRNATGK